MLRLGQRRASSRHWVTGGVVSRRLGSSALLAGVGQLQRQAAMSVLLRGPIERWSADKCGQLRTGSAGILLVKAGRVQTVATTEGGRRVVLGEAEEGEVLVCAQALHCLASPVMLLALEDSWLCPLDHEHLHDLAAYPAVLVNLVGQCVAQAEQIQAAALLLAHRRVEDRVLLALRILAERRGAATAAGMRLAPIPHRELARLANVTRPGATSALAQLEREGRLSRVPSGDLVVPEAAGCGSCREAARMPAALARLIPR